MLVISGFNHCFNELHASYTIVDCREIQTISAGCFSVFDCSDGEREVTVDIGESFDKTFRMSFRSSGIPEGFGCQVTVVADIQYFGRPVSPFQGQCVGFHLAPFQSALFSIDADADIVGLTCSDLCCGQDTSHIVFVTEECRPVVVDRTSGNECFQVGTELESHRVP